MKQLIALIAALLIINLGFSQTKKTAVLNPTPVATTPIATTTELGIVQIGANLTVGTNGSINRLAASGGGDIRRLQTLTQFAGLTLPATNPVFISDTTTGGIFIPYIGPDLPDTAMIVSDGNGNKYKRQTTDDKLYLKWYGVVPSTNFDRDDAPKFRKAIAYIKSHRKDFSALQLESCIPNEWYLIGSNINISGVKILGAGGADRYPSTFFQVFANVQPFLIEVEEAEVRDIVVRHYSPVSVDSFSHSFIIKSKVYFSNVSIVSNDGGNGFHILGENLALGNPESSYFYNCQAVSCHNGVYIKGQYAKNMTFELGNFVQSKSWGTFDLGGGNIYLTTHWASNSQVFNSGARVPETGGFTFYPNPDSLVNIIGKYPPNNPTYWYQTNFTGGNQNWDSTRQYYGGGALYANNPLAKNYIISCYTEDFQANNQISPQSVWYEGTAGSPIRGGIWQHSLGASSFLTGVGGMSSELIEAKKDVVFGSSINDAYAATVIYQRTPVTANRELIMPNRSGTIASSRTVGVFRDPTTADIPLNTYVLWANYSTTPQTLKLYVNLNGTLVVMKSLNL